MRTKGKHYLISKNLFFAGIKDNTILTTENYGQAVEFEDWESAMGQSDRISKFHFRPIPKVQVMDPVERYWGYKTKYKAISIDVMYEDASMNMQTF